MASPERPADAPIQSSLAERVYGALYDAEEARACKDIPENACTNVPRNFFLNAASLALTKWGDAIVNAKTTLPWLLTSLGAPGWVAGFLVPIRESGSMLPQLAIAKWIRELPVRKWGYVVGCVFQGACVLGLAACALTLTGSAAGLAILALVVLFSLARGVCSVASKDVLGKTVPKQRRGRVNGLAASVAGLGTIAFGLGLWRNLGDEGAYLWLLVAGGCFWFVAAAIYSRIQEEPGAVGGGANGLGEALKRISVIRDDADFRRFVVTRALLVGTALIAPFLVVMARSRADTSLAYFLLAQGVASLVSGHLWGAFADRSSRKVIIVTAILAGLLGIGVVTVDHYRPGLAATSWFLPLVFFLLAALHDGVRLGRKTYVVDLAGGNKRTDYVAVSNTLLGLVLLVTGGMAALAQQWSTNAAILLLSLTALAAAWVAKGLPEVQEPAQSTS